MCKISFGFAMLLSCNFAFADWTLLVSTSTKGEKFYIDPATLHYKGNTFKVWELLDSDGVLPMSDGDAADSGTHIYLSEMWLQEFDCAETRVKNLVAKEMSERMGQGSVVFERGGATNDWAYISPNTYQSLIMKKYCHRSG